MNRREFITLLGGAAVAWPVAARAQMWPAQVLRIICPIAAGGGIDATARIVAAQLSQIWGQQVSDQLEQWLVERACDGFVISATHVPGAYEDCVRFVVPELQRRGVFRKEYRGKTLRDHLQLPIPQIGAWRRSPAPTR